MSQNEEIDQIQRDCLDQEILLKIELLAKHSHLRALFEEQVKNPDAAVGQGFMTEEEFWSVN